ncbi:hypothetical protein V5N11_003277 [Cardamine amara subsp. amara]|uniref:Uncharacterized protein n=1 Tax=Cardamine amara subsp. amara TaxID=228776 RepID=A0ABD1BTP1_CARAN
MGCGKSKHDVVTGNTKTIRKPSEAESVKGKESETIKRQESCRCGKINDISAVVSGEQPETTVENISKKPEEKEAEGNCGDQKTAVEMTNDDKKPEEKETTTNSPPVTSVTARVPEDIVVEETVNDVNESVLPVDEQKEKVDIETVVEEDKSVEGKNDDDVDAEISSPEVEEPQSDVLAPETTESAEVQEIPTTENDEIAVTENDDVAVLKDEDKVDAAEENPADIKKEVESA